MEAIFSNIMYTDYLDVFLRDGQDLMKAGGFRPTVGQLRLLNNICTSINMYFAMNGSSDHVQCFFCRAGQLPHTNLLTTSMGVLYCVGQYP